ncbi:hypothetical protein GOP47_0007821, partial [Adiantum capillus-veneris]
MADLLLQLSASRFTLQAAPHAALHSFLCRRPPLTSSILPPSAARLMQPDPQARHLYSRPLLSSAPSPCLVCHPVAPAALAASFCNAKLSPFTSSAVFSHGLHPPQMPAPRFQMQPNGHPCTGLPPRHWPALGPLPLQHLRLTPSLATSATSWPSLPYQKPPRLSENCATPSGVLPPDAIPRPFTCRVAFPCKPLAASN